ncbi:MAG: hypothetical protein JSU59_03945 [Nitrospirota bacterium]|nr:MAG: hypothetical protein JSU59_03945 [Nitrospirota bacterium]
MNAERLWNLSLAFLVLFGLMLTGCTTSPKTTDTARSTMEQLLLAQALERTLVDARMPIDPAESVAVEAVGLTGDAGYAKSIVEEWLRKKGLLVGGEAPKYLVRVILQAFGTQNVETFIGIPPIQSTFIPLATPELAIYKNINQRGYARLNLEVSDKKTGALVAVSPVFEDEVFFEDVVWLFLFEFKNTDIVPPPL